MTTIPRRIQLDQFTTGERAIYDAVQAVEAMGADVRLTDAVILLQAARESVADYVDGVESRRHVKAEVAGRSPEDWQPTKEIEMTKQLAAVIIPARTVVHIDGIPVFLAVDTIVETAHDNMRLLTGHHYAYVPANEGSSLSAGSSAAPKEQ